MMKPEIVIGDSEIMSAYRDYLFNTNFNFILFATSVHEEDYDFKDDYIKTVDNRLLRRARVLYFSDFEVDEGSEFVPKGMFKITREQDVSERLNSRINYYSTLSLFSLIFLSLSFTYGWFLPILVGFDSLLVAIIICVFFFQVISAIQLKRKVKSLRA